MAKRGLKPVVLVLWDLYPALGSCGVRGLKRSSVVCRSVSSAVSTAQAACRDDLKYTVLVGGKVVASNSRG